jgi:hypothetical protein
VIIISLGKAWSYWSNLDEVLTKIQDCVAATVRKLDENKFFFCLNQHLKKERMICFLDEALKFKMCINIRKYRVWASHFIWNSLSRVHAKKN